VTQALEMGYRHIDTAQMYGNEAAVGEGIQKATVPREELFVATKVHPDNLAYDDVLDSVALSLEHLGIDHLDLLYVHWPTGNYDAEDTLAAFNHLRTVSTIDHVGLSNFTPELLDEALSVLDESPLAHQVESHPFLQQRELQAYARAHRLTLVRYHPLARGAVLSDPVLTDIGKKHNISSVRVAFDWSLPAQLNPPTASGSGSKS
jgi:2,5-diketo-D-gluconate reductase B